MCTSVDTYADIVERNPDYSLSKGSNFHNFIACQKAIIIFISIAFFRKSFISSESFSSIKLFSVEFLINSFKYFAASKIQ